jgi:hypothetical protein
MGGLPADESSADREICAPPIAVATTEDDREERCRVRLRVPREVAHFFRAVHASARLHPFHHLRGVHARQIRIGGSAPDALRYELPQERFTAGDRRVLTSAD